MKTFKEQIANSYGPSYKYMMGEFASVLLHSGTITHIMHLKARNYAAHMALGEFYAAIPDLVDTVVESYQGKYGIVEHYAGPYHSDEIDPIAYLQGLNAFVASKRIKLPQDSEIQNDIDSIVSQINSTLYKLRFLS